MAPVWLTAVAWVYLSVCFCCAGIVSCDIVFNQRRQPMGIMNFVFPITALYFGPFVLVFYWRWGRAASRSATVPMAIPVPMSMASANMTDAPEAPDRPASGIVGAAPATPPGERGRPWWVIMAIEVSHCGSGCALGDVISEFAIFWPANVWLVKRGIKIPM